MKRNTVTLTPAVLPLSLSVCLMNHLSLGVQMASSVLHYSLVGNFKSVHTYLQTIC